MVYITVFLHFETGAWGGENYGFKLVFFPEIPCTNL